MQLDGCFPNPVNVVALIFVLLLLHGCAGRSPLVSETISESAEQSVSPGICDGKLIVKDFAPYDCGSFSDLSISDTICLALPDGNVFSAVIERYSININQTLTVRTSIPDYPSGYLLISVTHCSGSGILRIPEIATAWKVYADTVTGVFSFKEVDPSLKIQRDSVFIPDY